MQKGTQHTEATRQKMIKAQRERQRKIKELEELMALARSRGFEVVNGKLMTPAELRKMRKAAGYDESGIQYGGSW